MKQIILIFISFIVISNNTYSQNDTYKERSKCIVISKDIVKENLTYPEEAKFSTSFVHEENGYGKCIVLGQVTASNAFGVKTKYTFKIWMAHNGKEWAERRNWELEKLILEDESKSQTVIDNRKKPVNDSRKRELGSIDGINCTFIEGSSLFTRIITLNKLSREQIKRTSIELEIKTDIIYFHLPNKTNRGEEYGMKNGNLIFLFDEK
jgi:hypothetical protein